MVGKLTTVFVVLSTLVIGCAGAAQNQKAGGDPTCVADGSFEADYYGCTGKPGATKSSGAKSSPSDAKAKNACLEQRQCSKQFGECTKNCFTTHSDPVGRDACQNAANGCKDSFEWCKKQCD